MKIKDLIIHLDKLLKTEQFSDYGPNGRQIEGKNDISKIAFAVSATKDSIEKAVKANADALIVHHGLFWRHQGSRPITGAFAKRIKPLIKHDINLLAYHLPLDAHPEVGNAATLAAKIDLQKLAPFGDYKKMPLGVKGEFGAPLTVSELASKLEKVLSHSVIVSSENNDALIRSMGIITGGANNDWSVALEDGLDAYCTGEISEYNWHDAKEAGIHMFAGGHHATEVFGIQALMDYLQKTYPDVETLFINSSNPA